MKKIFAGFSFKKLVLCILCTTVVTLAIGFTILFVPLVEESIEMGIIDQLQNDSEVAKEFMNSMQENYNNIVEEEKALYGEEYPAGGVLLYGLQHVKTMEIIETYILCLIIGVILGTVIYIVFIQKTKGIQMFLEIIICGIAIIVLIMLVNVIYNGIANAFVNESDIKIEYTSYVFDINNIIYIFIGIIVLSYIINLIYQKILSTKLNKKLEENEEQINMKREA